MKNEEMFIELLGDKYSTEILSHTSSMERSALLLCKELGIPLITNYFVPIPTFHGPCMSSAWCDLGNSPLRRKYREKVQV
jgi:hypothetical protein